MASKLRKLMSCRYLKPIEYHCKIYYNRNFSINQVLCDKLTVELLPEVEKSLQSDEIKHRVHPGIRKLKPISVPEILKLSVENIISEESEKLLRQESVRLCNHLIWRRLPAEKEDIDKKIRQMIPGFDGEYEEVPYILTKEQLKEMRKRINLEIGKWKPIEYDRHKSLVYLVGRLAANYGSVSHIFDELIKLEPTFKPQTFFDFGTGVGSALWAAHSRWSESIKEYFCTDISGDMNDLCESLITDETTGEKHIKPVHFRQFLPASDAVKYDLVVSAFSLLELESAADRLKVIDILWRKTKDFLIIIEYGTVAGFSCVLDARDYILQVENNDSRNFSYYTSGAHVISPCPHDFICPKFAEKLNSSCAFLMPYHPIFPRHHQQVILKDWVSYVIIKKSRRPDDSHFLPRIVKPVLKKPKHVICRLCCNDGLLKEVVVTKAKHGRHAYRCARQSSQGDILPVRIKPVESSQDED